MAGTLQPGASLPSEHDLARQFGVGRHTVRRGLAQLAAAGLVETQAGRGTFVTAPADPSTRTQTLQVAVYYPSAQTAKLGHIIHAFEEAHPLLRVQPLRLHPLGYAETVLEFIESGQGPDLILFMNGMLPALRPAEHFLDLGHFLANHPQLAGDIYPLLRRQFQWHGRQYGLPFVFSPVVMAYDREAFAEASVPEPDISWTRADLLDAAVRLTRRVREAPTSGRAAASRVERYGVHIHLASVRWPAIVYAGGGALATPDGTRGQLSTPASISAIQFMIDLAHRHGVSGPFSADLDSASLFVLRRAAMIATSFYNADHHQFSSSGIDWDVTLLPAAPASLAIPATPGCVPGEGRRHLFQSTGVAVNAHTPRLRAALAFLDFVISPRIQHLIRTTGCSLPARASIAQVPQHLNPRLHPRHQDIYLEAMQEDGEVPPFYSTAAAEMAHHELLLAFAGIEDVATACRRADAKLTAGVAPPSNAVREGKEDGWEYTRKQLLTDR